MIEADHKLRAKGAAIMTLARQRAIKAIKQEFHKQGLKLQSMTHREIVVAAEDYLTRHRAELLTEASETIDSWLAEGVFGKRAQRAHALAQRS